MSDAGEMNVERLSQLIAAQGREALLERLRTAYTEAAAAHSDIVSLDETRIEALVQNAAKEADGLQWRRALAGVASKELGVSVAEALSHPAVVRAQNELGAPSYEQSLTELITQPVPSPLPPVAAVPAPAPVPVESPPEPEPEPEPEPASQAPEPYQAPTPAPAQPPVTPPYEPPALAAYETPAPSPDSSSAPTPEDHFGYDDGYEAASPQAWDNEPENEPVPVIEGQLELASEVDDPSLAPSPEMEAEAEATAAPESTPPPAHTNWGDDPDPPSAFEHARAEQPATDDTLSEELEVIEADNTMVELLPEPEPVELDTQLYETVPLEADVVEHEEEPAPAPPPLAAVPSPPELSSEVEVPSPPAPEVESERPVGPLPSTYAATQPQSTSSFAHGDDGWEATPSIAPPPTPEPIEEAAAQPPPPVPVAPPPPFASPAAAPEPVEAEPAPEEEAEPELEPATFVHETPPTDTSSLASSPEVEAEDAAAESGEVEELRINAIHLGGVANLPTNREGLDLRLSSEGLDIMRGEDEIVGRLIWDEIEALEVPNQRKRRRNSQPAQARLVVRTRHGDASFEVPGYSSEELRDRVDLRIESYARR